MCVCASACALDGMVHSPSHYHACHTLCGTDSFVHVHVLRTTSVPLPTCCPAPCLPRCLASRVPTPFRHVTPAQQHCSTTALLCNPTVLLCSITAHQRCCTTALNPWPADQRADQGFVVAGGRNMMPHCKTAASFAPAAGAETPSPRTKGRGVFLVGV